LEYPQRWKEPKTIFVCSMADLFGEWVPDEWIETVFSACRAAPQHRYLFLTKNPVRYLQLAGAAVLPAGEAFWYGTTVTGPNDIFWWSKEHNTFASIEPMLQPFGRSDDESVKKVGWVVMGAMTGPGAKDHQPKLEWVKDVVLDADAAGVPVLMKDSLQPIVGYFNMRKDFPWEVRQ
jgi:protein gp37